MFDFKLGLEEVDGWKLVKLLNAKFRSPGKLKICKDSNKLQYPFRGSLYNSRKDQIRIKFEKFDFIRKQLLTMGF